MLTDRDLLKNKNQYSIDELRENVHHLNKNFLLHTQKLDEKFCVEFILDIRIDTGDEDAYNFSESEILEWQPHLDEKLFMELRDEMYYKNKRTG
jgi:hypothetical protein